jgi:hypothetical protein
MPTVPPLASSFVPPSAAAPISTVPLSADYGYGFNRGTSLAEGTTDPSAYVYTAYMNKPGYQSTNSAAATGCKL